MTITVQSRAPGGPWLVRNAFITENARCKAGSVKQADLLAKASYTADLWRINMPENRQLRVHDSSVRERVVFEELETAP
jgi:hypothetical protein